MPPHTNIGRALGDVFAFVVSVGVGGARRTNMRAVERRVGGHHEVVLEFARHGEAGQRPVDAARIGVDG